MSHKLFLLLALAVPLTTTAEAQDVTVGVTMGTRGPGASFGVSYSNAFKLMPNTIGGQPVKFIIYEDKADPTEAAKNARKLVTEDKVDVLMGSVSLLATTHVAQIADQMNTPLLALAPVVLTFDKLEWIFVLPQRTGLMMSAVVEHMKANGVKTVGYIGFSDAWGDFILNATENLGWSSAGIHVVSHERYSTHRHRFDCSGEQGARRESRCYRGRRNGRRRRDTPCRAHRARLQQTNLS